MAPGYCLMTKGALAADVDKVDHLSRQERLRMCAKDRVRESRNINPMAATEHTEF